MRTDVDGRLYACVRIYVWVTTEQSFRVFFLFRMYSGDSPLQCRARHEGSCVVDLQKRFKVLGA